MPYIDQDYYLNEYMGKEPSGTSDLKIEIMRASEEIDRLTGYRLLNVDIEEQPIIIVNQVKKATAQLVEHYILNGGYASTKVHGLSTVNIGKFQYLKGVSNSKVEAYPDNVVETLSAVGLLYSGVGVL